MVDVCGCSINIYLDGQVSGWVGPTGGRMDRFEDFFKKHILST